MTGFSWLPSRLLIVSRAKPSGGLLPCRWLAAKAAESAKRQKQISNTSADPDVAGHVLPPHSTIRWTKAAAAALYDRTCWHVQQSFFVVLCLTSRAVRWWTHSVKPELYVRSVHVHPASAVPGPCQTDVRCNGAMFWQWPSRLITLSLLVTWFALSACFCCCLSRFKLYFYMFVCLEYVCVPSCVFLLLCCA